MHHRAVLFVLAFVLCLQFSAASPVLLSSSAEARLAPRSTLAATGVQLTSAPAEAPASTAQAVATSIFLGIFGQSTKETVTAAPVGHATTPRRRFARIARRRHP
ncbi:hypothetical protein HYPSUDRAFT_199654 [Hypholoma sublateritium FD-334 SS-4]|uniref:Transmembrane protein n=1 Tax=Hypholoma sublateritium (strain FD-334 SS-4) TaxID=945553 RepID=A0A0D2P3M6_HYPSF|nr:hypothetical protein HYPSUDRAFT_199654 [Hypholoma sublateritium FD-334 SS-4]